MSGTTSLLISGPVLQLQSSTSSRVGGGGLSGSQTIYSSAQNDDSQQFVQKDQEVNEGEDPATRFQTKYASPDNVIAPQSKQSSPDNNGIAPNIAQLSLASIEADAVGVKPNKNVVGPAFSDTSSEMSDSPFHSETPTVKSENNLLVPANVAVTDEDLNQVEIFYRSHKSDVRVCRSLANLYVSIPKIKDRASLSLNLTEPNEKHPLKKKPSKKSKSLTPEAEFQYKPPPRGPEPTDIKKDEWEFCKTGIPVLVLDSGDHHRDRRLTIVLAERGTGFTLWSDVINHLTKYNTPHDNFHTITISTDHTRLVGLSFDDGPAATEFGEAVTCLMADPDDSLLNLSNKKKTKNKEKKQKNKYKPPKKIDISQPCCFVHVTKLEKPDYLRIPQLVFPAPPTGTELRSSRVNMLRALSDSSGLSDGSTTPSLDQ